MHMTAENKLCLSWHYIQTEAICAFQEKTDTFLQHSQLFRLCADGGKRGGFTLLL